MNPRRIVLALLVLLGVAAGGVGLAVVLNPEPPPTEVSFVIPAGKSATFRYRFLFHKGDAKAAGIDARFRAWAAGDR